jgi:putative membrane protein
MTQLSPFLSHLFTTLAHRPYVFIFLIAFLLFGCLQLGLTRTLLFLILGWAIAFASEVSSIRNGFPYGDYQYVYENLKGELLLWGVPLWDSLSYTFLAFASFSTATLVFIPLRATGRSPLEGPDSFLKIRTSWKVLILGCLLMMGIDVIIDPLTALGDRWFLGRIYYYPNGGIYFGVPLSNFLGWALVAFVIIFVFQGIDKILHERGAPLEEDRFRGLRAWLGAFLYLGVFFFNWSITVWLGLWKLAIADLILLSPLVWA